MEIDDPLRAAFERHFEGLFRMALLVTGTPHDAEDVVQEAFLKASGKLPSLPAAEVRPYLRAVVLNEWRSRLRRSRRLAARLPLLAQRDLPTATEIEDRDEIWTAVLRLAPRQRACVVLRFYEDLSVEETAAVLGCSTGTVKSQLHRALARIREGRNDADRR
jgi:RNA polymerase sigma-70 factor (sigma-E family)